VNFNENNVRYNNVDVDSFIRERKHNV